MADILMLAFFWLTRLHGLGGRAALQHLHARFFIGADDEASRLVEAQRLDRELTDVLRLGRKIWIVAVEPVDAPRRLEVGLLQDTPDAGAPRPGRRDSTGWRDNDTWPVSWSLSRAPPLAPRGKRAAGGPSAGHPA